MLTYLKLWSIPCEGERDIILPIRTGWVFNEEDKYYEKKNLGTVLNFHTNITCFYILCSGKKIEQIKVVAPAGTAAVSIVKPMKDTTSLDGTKIDYEVVPATDLIVARLTAKEADLAIVPVNLAAQLYQKQMPYKLTSVVTWETFTSRQRKTLKDGML